MPQQASFGESRSPSSPGSRRRCNHSTPSIPLRSLTRTLHWFQHEPCWSVRKEECALVRKAGESSTIWASPSPKFIMGGSDETRFDHPTEKPVELMWRPILNHLKRGEFGFLQEERAPENSGTKTRGFAAWNSAWTPVGLQNGAFEECFGCKCLRDSGGPGEIRTHDLFHAI